jgi:hypothetical protein
MANWTLSNIEVNYPSLNDKKNFHKYSDKNATKHYAIDNLTFVTCVNNTNNNNIEYCLRMYFCFDFSKSTIFEIRQKNSLEEEPLVEGNIDCKTMSNALEKLDLPAFDFVFNSKNFINNDTKYFYMENDDDWNYSNEQNIESIKSGDYGYHLTYQSKYIISEYPDSETESDAIKQIINNGIKEIFNTLLGQSCDQTEIDDQSENNYHIQLQIKLKSIPDIDQLLNEVNLMKPI